MQHIDITYSATHRHYIQCNTPKYGQCPWIRVHYYIFLCRNAPVSGISFTRLVTTLQRQNAENLKQIFPEKEYRGLSPNFNIHVSMSELYILTMVLPILLEEICRLILGINRSQTHECGNWDWGRAIPRKGIYKRNCRCSVGNHLGLHVEVWCGLTFVSINWWLNVNPVEVGAVNDLPYRLSERPAVK